MIYEYAIDPDLIIKWAKKENRRDYREFINAFGIGTPRIPSVVKSKKKWRLSIRQKISGLSGNEIDRVDSLIDEIIESSIERPNCTTEPHDWYDKTMREHLRTPFDHIFVDEANKSKCESKQTITTDDIDKYYERVWSYPTQKLVPRTEINMSQAIGNMLRLSSHIIIIDPYLGADWENKKSPLIIKFLEKSLSNRVSGPDINVEIIFSSQRNITEPRYKNACTPSFIHNTLIKNLGKSSTFINLMVKDIFEVPNGPKIHNRYVLTDIGGVIIGSGLEASSNKHEDEFILLERDLRYKRWKEYNLNFSFQVYESYPKI